MVGAFIKVKVPFFTTFMAATSNPINKEQARVRNRFEELLLAVLCCGKTCHWIRNYCQKSGASNSCLLYSIYLPQLSLPRHYWKEQQQKLHYTIMFFMMILLLQLLTNIYRKNNQLKAHAYKEQIRMAAWKK